MTRSIFVVPCFDEADRLPVAEFLAFAKGAPEVEFCFVNDGSRDGTLGILGELAGRHPDRFHLIDLQPNRGKAEAVRVGMLAALDRNPTAVGYWDADLATPLEEIPRFIEALQEHPARQVVFGARVQLLGRSIERNPLRHYLGRVFATAVSLALGLPVYDTQCGAKLFRASPETRALFEEPFCVDWTFDVEIVARLIRARRGTALPDAATAIYELPLLRWHDIAGSKVKPVDFLRSFGEVLRIHRRYLGRAARRDASRS